MLARESSIRQALERGEPEVGIFWLLPSGVFLKSSLPASEGIPYGDFVNGPSDHYRFWEQLRPHAPALQGLEYNEVPRVRINYHRPSGTYRILASRATLANPKLVRRIKQEFHITGQKVELIADAHYEIP